MANQRNTAAEEKIAQKLQEKVEELAAKKSAEEQERTATDASATKEPKDELAERTEKVQELQKFLDENHEVWEKWDVTKLTNNDWNRLYTETSSLHKILAQLDEYLTYFLQYPKEEHTTIVYLLLAKTEVLLCLQDTFLTDTVYDSELKFCEILDQTYVLASEQTTWDQTFARKKNMLRMSVLQYIMADDKESRRTFRKACALPVTGGTYRNEMAFSVCFEHHTEFQRHLPVEGYHYNFKHLEQLDRALQEYEKSFLQLMMDYAIYEEKEKDLLREIFSQMPQMASKCFELHVRKAGMEKQNGNIPKERKEKNQGLEMLKSFAETADRAPKQLQEQYIAAIWFIEATYATALVRDHRIEEADAFLKNHMTEPAKVHEELLGRTNDGGIIAQVTDMLVFCYYIVYSICYPMAEAKWREYRDHLSKEDFISARQIIDAVQKSE